MTAGEGKSPVYGEFGKIEFFLSGASTSMVNLKKKTETLSSGRISSNLPFSKDRSRLFVVGALLG